MSANSTIEWTDATWNVTLGCSKVSPGCKHCYAINHVHRMAGNPNPKIREANQGLTVIEGGHPNWNGKVRLIPERLEIPFRTRKPTRYFVNSLSDLFHEDLPDEDIDQVISEIAGAGLHTFLVLTKRDKQMRDYFRRFKADGRGWVTPHGYDAEETHCPINAAKWPIPNLWLGVSVEDRARKDRIEHLRETPAAVRFLSLEPLLEDLGALDLRGISWVIVGGESGPGARPMHPDWVRSLRDQCQAAGVAFFFKQWGEWAPATREHGTVGSIMPETGEKYTWIGGDGSTQNPSSNGLIDPVMAIARVGKKAAGRLLDGREWNEMPEARA